MGNALQLILHLLNVAIAAGAAIDQFTRIRAQVEAMVAEGRDPTPEEWEGLLADLPDWSARLEAANAKLNPGE
ncbi:hypothetical protein [Flavisphingomonas formosensis]|uniref:hypothetical protein n=1 Tax=Flavisphingomonas formosensis TaxID=861534 RepID=UPI0012FA9F76|nr:hypothetical protein [Sphingomonas formosensis]